ncbi:hypothetical protein D3C76_1731740 [compost metagenome]
MVASTRPLSTSSSDWLKPSVATTSAPDVFASWAKLLVRDWEDFLPFRSAKLLMLLLSLCTTTTALEVI